jgi:tetratricopeptide (TPR) repeat protein
MEDNSFKSRLLALVYRAHAQEHTMVDELSEAEREAMGTFKLWSAKDVIAHIAAWKHRQAIRLTAVQHGEIPPAFDDVDEFNAYNFELHKLRTWNEVLADQQRSFSELADATDDFSEKDLLDTQSFELLKNKPLWWGVAVNGYMHPLAHVANYYYERGNIEKANLLQETVAGELEQLDPSASRRGTVRYNLACYYATTGQVEKALPLLGEAFQLNPDLIEWSHHDSDLDGLRQEPAFQALYA